MNKRRTVVVTIAICTLLVLVLISSSALAQSSPSGVTMPYSSRLTDTAGQPVADGKYDFVFTLYTSEKDDQALWSETQLGLDIRSGDLNVALGQNVPLSKDVADRKELWLSVSVRGPQDRGFTLLNPRHNLNAPNAINALTCPHGHFTDYWGGTGSSAYGLEVDNGAGTGDGVRGYSGATLYNYAGVYGINSGGATGGGDGGSGAYAYSSNGYGGYFESGTYRALYAKGAPAWYAAYFENPGGSANTGLYVNGTIFVTGGKAGFVTTSRSTTGLSRSRPAT